MLSLLNIDNKIIVYILAATLIVVSVLFVYNFNKSNRLQKEVNSLQVINKANIVAIASLNKIITTTNIIITEWSERDNIFSDELRGIKDEIQKEIESNEAHQYWSNEPVPDSFIIMLKRNIN